MPIPTEASRAGCCVYPTSGKGACEQPIAYAGRIFYSYSRETWRAFACAEHRDALIDSVPFGSTPVHQEELDRRIEVRRAVLAGQPHVPTRPVHRGSATPDGRDLRS